MQPKIKKENKTKPTINKKPQRYYPKTINKVMSGVRTVTTDMMRRLVMQPDLIKRHFEMNEFGDIKNEFEMILAHEKLISNDIDHQIFYDIGRKSLFDGDGNFPLSWATKNGHLNLVKMLVEEYDFPLDFQNYEGMTCLSIAVSREYTDIVNYLLDKGANPNIPNLKKETPLHFAACIGDNVIVSKLIEKGAWIETEDDFGDTCLHWAVRENNFRIVNTLIKHGGNIDHPNYDEETPKDLAKELNREMADYLESITELDSLSFDLKANDSVPISPPNFYYSNDKPIICSKPGYFLSNDLDAEQAGFDLY